MDRLETLKALLERDFISQAEYEERRRQIIDELTKTSLITQPTKALFDEEEGFGSKKQKAAQLEEDEENFGPKKSKALLQLPLKTTTTTTTTSCSDKDELMRDVVKDMGIADKYELSRQIGSLPGTCLRVILEIVKDSSPEALERSGEDWIFDLKTLPSSTLWKLHDYVEAWNKEDNKERGSQGEEKQVLAATVLTTNEEQDTDTRPDGGRGQKRPRATPILPLVETPEKPVREEKAKKPTRAVKKSKIIYSESEEEECETESREKEQQQSQSESSTGNEKEVAKEKKGEPFKIQVCIYRLSKKNSSARPYICDACGKSFKDRSNLSQHLRVHTKEKPYVCSFDGCKKSFAHSASLKEHLNSHCGAKPHICDFPGCGQSFAQASNLRRHQRGVHGGERPFECTYYGCGKKFAQNSNLKQHMDKVHGVKKADDERMQIHT